jgi:hypothetical protein
MSQWAETESNELLNFEIKLFNILNYTLFLYDLQTVKQTVARPKKTRPISISDRLATALERVCS